MSVPAFDANNFSFHVEVSLFHQLTGNWLCECLVKLASISFLVQSPVI